MAVVQQSVDERARHDLVAEHAAGPYRLKISIHPLRRSKHIRWSLRPLSARPPPANHSIALLSTAPLPAHVRHAVPGGQVAVPIAAQHLAVKPPDRHGLVVAQLSAGVNRG